MKPVIAAILFLLTGVTVQAQYRELVGRPYPRRLDAIDRLYGSVIAEEMPAGDVADTLKGMRALAEELDDEELLLEADLLEASYDLEVGAGSLEKMQQTLDKATEAGISHVVYRAVWCIGQYYWMQEKYE
ncbi:hypothetical protein [Parapedobacter soli]|uniref:hypothetical protein n=1 Tax=Parapedobacter soli TaxID=416955 RepID=UPI0021C5EF2B|nr:hypothetical protein [Parapedobacter soli]